LKQLNSFSIRGTAGPSSVVGLPHAHRVTSLFVEAAAEMGLKTYPVDLVYGEKDTFSYAHFTLNDGKRLVNVN